MTITYLKGDIWRLDVEALVIPVNTVGAMGKGLALQCAVKHRDLETLYKMKCKHRQLRMGAVMIWKRTLPYIVLVPTKTHWRLPSTTGYIYQGCVALKGLAARERFQYVAVPWLGCGEGGLRQEDVTPIFEDVLGSDTRCQYLIVDNTP